MAGIGPDAGDRKLATMADLENRFRYHAAATDIRKQEHQNIRDGSLRLAELFLEILPPGREQALAWTKVEEAMFWANAALARQPDGPGEDAS